MRVLSFPFFSLLFFGITSAMGLLSTSIFLGVPIDPLLTASFGAIVFCVYGINRYTDIEDMLNDPEKRVYFNHNRYLLPSIIALLSLTLLGLYMSGKLMPFHFFITGIGAAYSIPLIPIWTSTKKFKRVRLKDLTFAKSLTVSVTLGSSFFIINWLAHPSEIGRPLLTLLTMFSGMLVIYVNTNFCDIRDVVGDRAEAIPTIPVRYGVRKTILYTALMPTIIWLSVVAVLWFFQLISSSLVLFYVFNAAYPGVYFLLYFSQRLGKKTTTVIADLSVFFFCIGLLLLRVSGA